MKKIVKVIPQRMITRYQCGHCGTKYKSFAVAKKCESMLVEKKSFCIGDLVSWREWNTCSYGKTYGKTYHLRGKITKIFGPTLPDEEYNIKWLQGKLTGLHVYRYVVDWKCKYCERPNSGLFYGMELTSVERADKTSKK